MDMQIIPLRSGDQLPCIEHHFKVTAGPGAGKTHWLVEHIKNVLHQSERLGKSRKIACITYTNIAVKTILKRLGNSRSQVEVSTIHSFLYKNLIKPYVYLIAETYGLKASKIDGHYEMKVGRQKVIAWIKEHSRKDEFKDPFSEKQLTTPYKGRDNLKILSHWLSSFRYSMEESELKPHLDNTKACDSSGRNRLSKECLDILGGNSEDLLEFKKLFWKDGILHHDDVLFFSYKLVEEYPFLLDVLRAKFPYFFVDEFQDSSPIQVDLLKKIGQKETIVGIIGDRAQCIYSFQGAQSDQLEKFTLYGMKHYPMDFNRRSTKEIVCFLNEIRCNFPQQPYREEVGKKPILYVGEAVAAFNEIIKECQRDGTVSLSRKNVTSNAMRSGIEGGQVDVLLMSELQNKDSNGKRRKAVVACVKAIELARQGKFKDALVELRFVVEGNQNIALCVLEKLLQPYSEYSRGSCTDFIEHLISVFKEHNTTISKPTSGAPRKFYNETTYEALSLSVNIIEDESNHKTIHKAKGDEFDNVLLVLEKDEKLEFITCPDLKKEEHRVMYVGASRAKNNLFFVVKELGKVKRKKLSKINAIEIIDLSST